MGEVNWRVRHGGEFYQSLLEVDLVSSLFWEGVAEGEGFGEPGGGLGMVLVEVGVEPVAHEHVESGSAVVAAGAEESPELAVVGVAVFGFSGQKRNVTVESWRGEF